MPMIFLREFKAVFKNIKLAIALAVLALCSGIFFVRNNLMTAYSEIELVLSSLTIIIALIVPLVAIFSVFKERQERSDVFMATLPFTRLSIILGKFFGVFIACIIPLLTVAVYPLVLVLMGAKNVLGSYVAIAVFYAMTACLCAGGLAVAYMFKKMWGSSFFKVIVFMPSIVSSICTVTIFKYIVNRVIFALFDMEVSLLDNDNTAFGTIMFYSLWLSFGSGMLTQIGAMNATDQSTIDAGQIDGVGFFGELWHIVLPKSYGVISIGFYTGFASLFTNQLSLYAFKGDSARGRIMTLGYYYYVEVQKATDAHNFAKYPFWSAWGLISSAITIPTTFLLRFW